MKNKTVVEEILAYLEGCSNVFIWGGQMAREIAGRCKCKESVVERRARELVNEGKIEVTREQVNGEGPLCVKYRFKKPEPMPSPYEAMQTLFN